MRNLHLKVLRPYDYIIQIKESNYFCKNSHSSPPDNPELFLQTYQKGTSAMKELKRRDEPHY